MQVFLHKADQRGYANHGWLKSYHSFSFANYYDPAKMGFGALRVINDDLVAPSMGFGTHPHQDMEIISIPLKGSLKHKDTMGNDYVIQHGEVQAMSAGTGIAHSEYNNSSSEDVSFLQIWVIPKLYGIQPRYSQKEFPKEMRDNQFQLIVSPDARDHSVQINQDAFFSLIKLSKDRTVEYKKYIQSNGVYFFNLSGKALTCDYELDERDGLGVQDIDDIKILAKTDLEFLIIEVPML